MAKYINDKKLTNEAIENILNECGLEIISSKQNNLTGEIVSFEPIMRLENQIIVNCRNKDTSKLANILYCRFPMLGQFNLGGGAYSVGDEVVVFEDFFASRLKLSDELDSLDENLFNKYQETMRKIFGKEYENDSEKYFEEVLLEESKRDGESPKKDEASETPKEKGEMGSE